MTDSDSTAPIKENTEKDTLKVKAILESILFASGEPVSAKVLFNALKDDFSVSKKDITELIIELKEEYESSNRGFQLVSVAEGYQLKTKPPYSPWVKKVIKCSSSQEKLSKPALETLAIVAYKQPISRGEIEQIRGVNVDGTMRALIDKGLIFASGRKDIPGKPWLYSTTKAFLTIFGLKNLQELPPLGELNLN
jgi:segregation and condensation protein B